MYSTLYLHSTFNLFKACLHFLRLTLCGVRSVSFSAHFLQARTMSHREVKWWVKGSSASSLAHAALLSWVKLCGRANSNGANMSQATSVRLLTLLCGHRASGKWNWKESLFVSSRVLYTLSFEPFRWASFHKWPHIITLRIIHQMIWRSVQFFTPDDFLLFYHHLQNNIQMWKF